MFVIQTHYVFATAAQQQQNTTTWRWWLARLLRTDRLEMKFQLFHSIRVFVYHPLDFLEFIGYLSLSGKFYNRNQSCVTMMTNLWDNTEKGTTIDKNQQRSVRTSRSSSSWRKSYLLTLVKPFFIHKNEPWGGEKGKMRRGKILFSLFLSISNILL